jgi:hypothetical protein
LVQLPQEEVVAGADLTGIYKRRKGINNATTTISLDKRQSDC